MRDYYNEVQAAEYTSLSVRSIKRAISSGSLVTVAGMRVEGNNRIQRNIISHEALVAWLTGEKEDQK